ncbi:polysaccharide pyruvyl transferase family protein [Clostridium sp. CF011]|uniref:polysaccharide pyruvyl transferase family protein n=1 Tax=Clostridium sp. CF011 TaxID=2843318 RepID=UPI001C0DC347|nr:polysaccharide pyruvyl transferase family protein [Clostridium sp. CF011]MBU3093650.1 polysaccharide pyruvyl transferase family protein [Clostridium sp. CF011]WAG69344.1 polysaccharide pyruvyl transferase family protein [Clostridium sp. CF011]
MKISILTMHFAENYGAQLQAYGLQTYLQSIGYNVEILDFRPSKLITDYKMVNFKSFKKIISDCLRLRTRKKQVHKFKDFMNRYLNLSSEQYDDTLSKKTFINTSDIFICGSDQIWNLPLTGYSYQYFLDFIDEKKHKKISYAASFGDSIQEKDKESMESYLGTFDAVSVRENSSMNIISTITNKDCLCVLDPVFLLNSDHWRNLSCYDTNLKPQSYILLYDLIGRGDKVLIKKAKIEAKRLNLKIVSIHPLTTKRYGADYNLCDVGSEEFLWLIDNAALVCTNSFHATSFSLIFEKGLIVNHRKGKFSRTKALLELFNMEYINEISEIPGVGIQYINKENQKILEEEIRKSVSFIKNSIGTEKYE